MPYLRNYEFRPICYSLKTKTKNLKENNKSLRTPSNSVYIFVVELSIFVRIPIYNAPRDSKAHLAAQAINQIVERKQRLSGWRSGRRDLSIHALWSYYMIDSARWKAIDRVGLAFAEWTIYWNL